MRNEMEMIIRRKDKDNTTKKYSKYINGNRCGKWKG